MGKSSPESLAAIQQWMHTAITHPDGVLAGAEFDSDGDAGTTAENLIEQVVLPSAEMSSADRLRIYGQAYFARLIECLQAQFPTVLHAIGEDAFNQIAFAYLVQYPSTDYSLGPLGRSFESFLAATRPARSSEAGHDTPDFADFLIELARLEWIYSDVFNGNGPECSAALSARELARLTPDEFASSRLVPYECVRLQTFQFPVQEYITSIRRQAEASIPQPRPVSLVICRRNYVVRRFEVTSQQFRLLTDIINHATIGEAIEQMCEDPEANLDTVQLDLQNWFREWTAAPLFAGRIPATESHSPP